tara:strand:- start:120 stop:323 length:204 start_codon:yes stop_codon:yes gene_type:complete
MFNFDEADIYDEICKTCLKKDNEISGFTDKYIIKKNHKETCYLWECYIEGCLGKKQNGNIYKIKTYH